MNSPESSPDRNLHGASRTVGGIFRGHAVGNVYNNADFNEMMGFDTLGPVKGKVYLFISSADPATINPVVVPPSMVFKQDLGLNFSVILQKLARLYSPISGEICLTSLRIY